MASTPIHNVFVTNPKNIGPESEVSLPATVEESRTISVGFKTAGQIEKILVKGEENKLCTECEGALHNKPIVGMVIVNNMEWRDGKLQGGTILDPDNGKTYYAKMWLDPATGKLILRGSLDKRGLLGRNQQWVRK